MNSVWILVRRIAVVFAAAAVVISLTVVIGNQFSGEMPSPPERDAMMVGNSEGGSAAAGEVDGLMGVDGNVAVERIPPVGGPETGGEHGHGQASFSAVALSVAMNGAKVLAVVAVISLVEWLIVSRRRLSARLARQKPMPESG